MLNKASVSIDELRTHLSDLVGRVMYGQAKVTIKKYNRDAAVLISVDEYEKLLDPTKRLSEGEWQEKFRHLDEIRSKIPKVDPDILDRVIDDAVDEVRADKRA